MYGVRVDDLRVVFNLSKIHNLKRFTTEEVTITHRFRCIQSVKDT